VQTPPLHVPLQQPKFAPASGAQGNAFPNGEQHVFPEHVAVVLGHAVPRRTQPYCVEQMYVARAPPQVPVPVQAQIP
jgi:hypothetical protein